jgi:hypothetical protein
MCTAATVACLEIPNANAATANNLPPLPKCRTSPTVRNVDKNPYKTMEYTISNPAIVILKP